MQEMPGAALGSPQDGNSLLRLVLLGPGAEWRLLVGGKRQVLAAVRPTSHCSATEDGGITQADGVACNCPCLRDFCNQSQRASPLKRSFSESGSMCLETDVSEVDAAWHWQVILRRHVGLLY